MLQKMIKTQKWYNICPVNEHISYVLLRSSKSMLGNTWTLPAQFVYVCISEIVFLFFGEAL